MAFDDVTYVNVCRQLINFCDGWGWQPNIAGFYQRWSIGNLVGTASAYAVNLNASQLRAFITQFVLQTELQRAPGSLEKSLPKKRNTEIYWKLILKY